MPAVSAQLLAPQARALLFDPPVDRDEALRRCALAPEDLALVQRHRRSQNRLGFAVQLALVRDLGRPLRLEESLPDAVVEAVADQLGVEPAVFGLYARRDSTRREHAGEIAAFLDLRPMRQADYRASIRAAATCAVGTDRGEPIARAVVADLKERRITGLGVLWPQRQRTWIHRPRRVRMVQARATARSKEGTADGMDGNMQGTEARGRETIARSAPP